MKLFITVAPANYSGNADIDFNLVPEPFEKLKGKGILVLNKINEYHREYIWV